MFAARCAWAFALTSCLGPAAVRAENWLGAGGGKLLLTAGFSTFEGAGGGALATWALVSGYGSSSSWGANVHATSAPLRDFELSSSGVSVGALDRSEISASRQFIEATGTSLEGVELSQDVYGLRIRLLGDAVYAQDSWLPQIAVGVQFKRHDGIRHGDRIGAPMLMSPVQLGALDDEGVDYYLSASRLSLEHSFFISAAARYTKANQLGLLGFGGERGDDASIELEMTLAYLVRRQIAVGAEFRTRPDNLAADDEDPAWDAFVAWAPNRHFSLVAAHANLGGILAPLTGVTQDQDGAYVSVQLGF